MIRAGDFVDIVLCGGPYEKGGVPGRPRANRCDHKVAREEGATPRVPAACASTSSGETLPRSSRCCGPVADQRPTPLSHRESLAEWRPGL